MILQGKAKYPVREVMLHCAAIKTGQFNGKRALDVFRVVDRWHVERGFKGFGYHGLFMPDGEYYPGRPFAMIGAGCIGHNQGVLHFLLIESREIKPGYRIEDATFGDFYTEAQASSLRFQLRYIAGLKKVSGHNDYAPKLCPGFKVQTDEWL